MQRFHKLRSHELRFENLGDFFCEVKFLMGSAAPACDLLPHLWINCVFSRLPAFPRFRIVIRPFTEAFVVFTASCHHCNSVCVILSVLLCQCYVLLLLSTLSLSRVIFPAPHYRYYAHHLPSCALSQHASVCHPTLPPPPLLHPSPSLV